MPTEHDLSTALNSPPATKLITILPGKPDVAALQFASNSEVAAWATAEESFWTELNVLRDSGPVESIIGLGKAANTFSNIRTAIVNGATPESVESAVRDAANEVGWLVGNHPIRLLLDRLKRRGESPRVLAVMYALHLRRDAFERYTNEVKYVADVATASAHLAIYRQGLDVLHLDDYVEAVQAFRIDATQAITSARVEVANAEVSARQWRESADSQLHAADARLNDELVNFREDVEKTKKLSGRV